MKKVLTDKPYNDLPLLPPKADLETKFVLKQLVASHKALAEIKGYVELLPNINILLNSLILKEAKDSSAIENIITTDDVLYQALATNTKNIDPQTKEVLNYRTALWAGYEFLQKRNILTTNTIIKIQNALSISNAGIRKLPGTVLKNSKTGQTIYAPPDGEQTIRSLLKNLEDYINNDDLHEIDPLIKIAVIHYQFESIHPFYDGNGRTGRIINVLYLILKGLLNNPILYISSYIIKHKAEYYRLLQEVRTKNTWEKWTIYMLKAIEETALDTLNLVKKIKSLMAETTRKIKTQLPLIYSRELLDVLFQQPYTKIKFLEDKQIAKRQTASDYLYRLKKIGVLKSEKIGKETLFLNIKLYNLFKE
jgi:Fic family protein